jgi:hypothetical protein
MLTRLAARTEDDWIKCGQRKVPPPRGFFGVPTAQELGSDPSPTG